MQRGIYAILVLTALVLQSCTKDFWKYHGHGHGHDDPEFIDVTVDEGRDDQTPNIIFSPDKLVISFDPSLNDAERQAIRDEFFVTVTESCNCGDTNIERWTIDTTMLDIEGAVSKLKSGSGGSNVEGDQEFDVILPRVVGNFAGANDFDQTGGEEIVDFVPDGSEVNIAILDTGLDYLHYDLSADPYLYEVNASCFPTFSGWNFISQSNDVLDRHGHGTYVTGLTTAVLDEFGVGYNILPLKVFDGNGQGSFWNVMCALGYVRDIQQNGGNINIVNASFGGAMEQEILQDQVVLSEILEDLKDLGVLVVTSAGNKGVDTDDAVTGHFISGNKADNIFAVGGYDDATGTVEVHSESNYGMESIDIAVPFGGYAIELNTDNPGEIVRAMLSGTSYSAAYMSGFGGMFSDMNGVNGTDLKNGILGIAVDEPGLNNQIKDNKAIIVN
ncbi:MAG: S8 family serine peptidase [Aurantibacter sp.]